MLIGVELGVWSVGPESIDFIADLILRRRPSLVIECGSGVSTLAIALFLSRIGRSPNVRLVALEQDELYAEATRGLLRRHGLSESVAVIHAPLVEDVFGTTRRVRYSLPLEFELALGGRRAEFIVIDGPVADEGGRFATLPILAPFADRAMFVMDDALRDSELRTAAEWARIPFITVQGIIPIGKGLLIGKLGE